MIDLNKEREVFDKEFGVADFNMFASNDENLEQSMVLKCNWLGWKACAEQKQSEINELNAKLEAAQVPEGFVLVPKEFNEKLAEKMAAEMVNKPIPENDPVLIEIANKAYKDNLLMKKWVIIRNYKAMIEAAQEILK